MSIQPTWLQHWQQTSSVAEACQCFICLARDRQREDEAESSSWKNRIRDMDEATDRELGRKR